METQINLKNLHKMDVILTCIIEDLRKTVGDAHQTVKEFGLFQFTVIMNMN